MSQKIDNQGDYNVNINGVTGDITIINSLAEITKLQEIILELMERLETSQNQVTTLLEIIKNHNNDKR